MGGNIGVNSQEGKGSKFTVILRFQVSEESAARLRHKEQQARIALE